MRGHRGEKRRRACTERERRAVKRAENKRQRDRVRGRLKKTEDTEKRRQIKGGAKEMVRSERDRTRGGRR